MERRYDSSGLDEARDFHCVCSSMVERQNVTLESAGSSPVKHPASSRKTIGYLTPNEAILVRFQAPLYKGEGWIPSQNPKVIHIFDASTN